MPSQERLRELFDYNPETGILINKIARGDKIRAGSQVSYREPLGYIVTSLNRRNCRAHRIIWTLLHGSIPPRWEIDHINGIRDDNRLTNLRLATRKQQCRNTARSNRNTSGTTGVYFSNTNCRWIASIYDAHGNYKHLGGFLEKEDAIAARHQAEVEWGYHPNHGRNSIYN
jgi:hypothetical protein